MKPSTAYALALASSLGGHVPLRLPNPGASRVEARRYVGDETVARASLRAVAKAAAKRARKAAAR